VVWHLDDHKMSASPRNTANPDVERLVSGQPAQSASVYVVNVGVLAACRCSPCVVVPLM
jgi:hypothetical protein